MSERFIIPEDNADGWQAAFVAKAAVRAECTVPDGYEVQRRVVRVCGGAERVITFYAKIASDSKIFKTMAPSLEVAFRWALDRNKGAKDAHDELTYGEGIRAIEELQAYALSAGMTREEITKVYRRAWESPEVAAAG